MTEICGRCYDFVDDTVPAPCKEDPEALAGLPLGQYHCPDCGAMVCAGVPHPRVCVRCAERRHPAFDPNPVELGAPGSAKWVDGPPLEATMHTRDAASHRTEQAEAQARAVVQRAVDQGALRWASDPPDSPPDPASE